MAVDSPYEQHGSFREPGSVMLGPVRVHKVTEAEVLDRVVREPGGVVHSVNTDTLRQAWAEPEVAELLNEASLRIADGMPIVWAARIAGDPLPARVAGSTLVVSTAREAARNGRSVFLLGGAPGAADAAARVLHASIPGLRVAGTYCPPFGFEADRDELVRVRAAVHAAAADIVFVGLGFPKQEWLIKLLREDRGSCWYLSCGITFSFIAGDVKRAPVLVQRLGLEWLHRMLQEPRRLFRRYILLDAPFLVRLLVATLARRVSARA